MKKRKTKRNLLSKIEILMIKNKKFCIYPNSKIIELLKRVSFLMIEDDFLFKNFNIFYIF